MKPLQPMANDELADLYCALRSEYVDLTRLVPFPDPGYFADLANDINQIHDEIAARGMFECEAA